MSEETKPPPKAFPRFVEEVKRLFSQAASVPVRRLTILGGPNEKDIAQQAEKTPVFGTLAVALFPAPMGRLHSSIAITSEVFRRSGFYGRVKAGQFVEELWARIEPHTRDRKVPWHVVLMLDGCFFPEKSFKLLGHTVNAMTDAEARVLQPPQDFFFPYETVAPSFTERWSLICEKEYGEKAPKPGWISFGLPRENVPFDFWAPLFCLGLYNPAPFYVTKALEGEPGYKLYRPLDGRAHYESVTDANGESVEIPAQFYQVTREEWERFQKYLRFYKGVFAHIESWPERDRRFLRLAGRRYLRATFMIDPEADAYEQDEREDVLLQYMFSLEGLLVPDGGDSIAYKISTRGAVVVGGNDAEREEIRSFLKQVYDARSKLAHGDEPKKPWDLPRLREVYRMTCLVILKLSESRTLRELEGDIPRLAVSEALREEVQRARGEVLSLVQAPNLNPTPVEPPL